MEYRKEKNFIIATDEKGNIRGTWDILTGKFTGVNNRNVKSIPAAFTNHLLPKYLEYALEFFKFHQNNSSIDYSRLEQLLSLEICIAPYDRWTCTKEDNMKLTKDYVQFLQEAFNNVHGSMSAKAYSTYSAHRNFLDHLTPEEKTWAIEVFNEIEKTTDWNFVEKMIFYAIHEKVNYQFDSEWFAECLSNWEHMVLAMGEKLEAKRNVMTNKYIIQYLYDQYKDTHYDAVLNRQNNCGWLYFENDQFVVVPLLTKRDFHIEAETQQNCVERLYMERVAQGMTHVVGIRKKDDRNTPYITCEIDNDGNIEQYLLRFNTFVNPHHNPAEIQFRNLYQEYLDKKFNRG